MPPFEFAIFAFPPSTVLKVAALKGNNHYLLSKGIDPVLVSRRLRTTSIKRKRKKAKIRAAIFLYFFFLFSSKTFRYGEKTDNCEKEEKHLRNLEYRKILQEPPSCSWKKTITTTMRVKGLNGLDEGRRVKSSKKAKGGLFLCYRKQPFRWPLVGFWIQFRILSEADQGAQTAHRVVDPLIFCSCFKLVYFFLGLEIA